MLLKLVNKVLPEEMYGMDWTAMGGSKGHKVVMSTKGVATPLYVVMLSASHSG